MIGRSFARNWRWRRVKIRIIFRASLIGSHAQRLLRLAAPQSGG